MPDQGLAGGMRRTSSGAYCARCQREGVMQTTRQDMTPMDESDRCIGCGNLVCDRHTLHRDMNLQERHDLMHHEMPELEPA